MFILPNKVKKPTKILYVFEGIKTLLIFGIVFVFLYSFNEFLNGFIQPLYLVFVFAVSLFLILPSRVNYGKMNIQTLYFYIFRRKEFEKTDERNVKKIKEWIGNKRFEFIKRSKENQIKKIKF